MRHLVCASVRPAVWQSLAPANQSAFEQLKFNDQLDSRGNQHSPQFSVYFKQSFYIGTIAFTADVLPILEMTPDWETSLTRCRPQLTRKFGWPQRPGATSPEAALRDHQSPVGRSSQRGVFQKFQPWRIHSRCCEKNGVPWIPSRLTPVMLALIYQHQPDPSWGMKILGNSNYC